MTTGPYRVGEVENADITPCTCDNCDWQGTADETGEIGDCCLTPGDASPVGRCPECDGLCYVDQPLRKPLRKPIHRPTNVEFVTELMEYSDHGALMQAFVLDALGKWAQYVINHADQVPDHAMFSKEAWVGCAEELKAKLEEHLK